MVKREKVSSEELVVSSDFVASQQNLIGQSSDNSILTTPHSSLLTPHFKQLLDSKSCFKLICGAGNENLEEIERLVALYAKSGCRFFDLSASKEVLAAAQRGLDFAIPKEQQKDYHFCISIGTKNDQHVQKAVIDPEKCKNCGKCVEICPQDAISKQQMANSRVGLLSHRYEIVGKNCIGCMKCQKVCEFDAISFHISHFTFHSLLTSHLSLFTCIELHASDTDEAEVDEIWEYLNENFDGMLSLCLSRRKLSNEQVLNRIKRLIKDRKPYTTIIQADGSPMSGGEDDYKTTLQAVAMAELVQSANLPVYVLLSGGTNSKTAQLANLCGVNFNGIAVGSYARKIVKKYIERKDFFKNEAIFEEALKIARFLIK